MSGHSKWSQIKHKKGISDAKKANIFSKLAKIITIAAKDGADPEGNYKLKSAIERARAENMPKDNIERAIKNAQDKDIANLKEIIIQAIGPVNSGFIIKAITDNSNRTIQEIKLILSKHQAKMAAEGSLDWMFEHKASQDFVPLYPISIEDRSALDIIHNLMEAIDNHDDVENIYSNIDNL